MSEPTVEAALEAAVGILFALPRSAQSKRRSEVLAQCRAALAAAREAAPTQTRRASDPAPGGTEVPDEETP